MAAHFVRLVLKNRLDIFIDIYICTGYFVFFHYYHPLRPSCGMNDHELQCHNTELTLLFVNLITANGNRETSYPFCSWICCRAEWNGSCSIRWKNDVCVAVFSVNFKMLYFMWPNKELRNLQTKHWHKHRSCIVGQLPFHFAPQQIQEQNR